MAYFNQERKAVMAPKIKEIAKKYGVKARLAVYHHSTVVLNISAGKIDFMSSYNRIGAERATQRGDTWQDRDDQIQVNPYWYHEHFDGKALDFLKEAISVLYAGNHDNSEPQTDYHDVGWYVNVNVGQFGKPYKLEA